MNKKDKQILNKFFTNTDDNVFALKNLPDPLKGALLARYSRTGKGLREVFLKEFAKDVPHHDIDDFDHERTKKFYEKVLDDYGDDSVAQLGSVHVACEGVSNLATKAIERGRMASYIEQSTRYQDYSKKPFVVPKEITDPEHIKKFKRIVNKCLKLYGRLINPKFKSSFDLYRGLLPVCMGSNLGIYANGQALERMIMRLLASELQENREIGEKIYQEANKVVPEYLRRIKRPDRGQEWIKYLSKSRRHKSTRKNVSPYLFDNKDSMPRSIGEGSTIFVIDFDHYDYIKLAASVSQEMGLMNYSEFIYDHMDHVNETLSLYECSKILEEYRFDRKNRRHLPGRAFEFAYYDFLIVGDYAAFRDLQRHRIGTIDWGLLKTDIGYNRSIEKELEIRNIDPTIHKEYKSVLKNVIEFHRVLEDKYGAEVAQYIVPMMFNIEYRIKINARQLLYMAELRMRESGHKDYREILKGMVDLVDVVKRDSPQKHDSFLSNSKIYLPTSKKNLIL